MSDIAADGTSDIAAKGDCLMGAISLAMFRTSLVRCRHA